MRYQNDYPACFEDFILLGQTCSKKASKSGLYIENLEGMSLKRASQMASSSYQSSSDLVHDKMISALNQLEVTLQNHLSSFGIYVPVFPEIQEHCGFIEGKTNAPLAAKRGIKITRYANVNPFRKLFVESVYIRSKVGTTTDLIFEDNFGAILHTISVNIPANELITVDVNMAFAAPVFKILLDNAVLETYQTECYNLNTGCCAGIKSNRPNKAYWIEGFDGAQTSNNSFGIGARIGMQCDIKTAMCKILNYIKMPILYLTGVELLKEHLGSDRVNFLTIHNREWAAEKIEEWQMKADQMIKTNIMSIINNLRDYDNKCIACNPTNKPKIYSLV